MNYRLIERDGKKLWQKILAQPDGSFAFQDVEGALVLQPDTMTLHDEVMVTHRPPIIPENGLPFEEWITSVLKDLPSPKAFKPYVDYCTTTPGGAITVYLSPDDFYGEWINPYLTLYRKFSDQTIVGFRVEGLLHLKAQHDCAR